MGTGSTGFLGLTGYVLSILKILSILSKAVTSEYGVERSPELMLLARYESTGIVRSDSAFADSPAAVATCSFMILLLLSSEMLCWLFRIRRLRPRSSSVDLFLSSAAIDCCCLFVSV